MPSTVSERLAGRTALVTGGGTGIGAAIARRLAEEGARVVLTGRRTEPLQSVAASLPEGRGAVVAGDVTREEDVARVVDAAVEHGGGRLDALVNNAGAGGAGSVTDLSPAQWREGLDV